MAFKDVWGFDPDEAAQAQARFRQGGGDQSADAGAHELDGLFPPDPWSQIYELRRMFRL